MKYLEIIATLILVMLCVISAQLYFNKPPTYGDRERLNSDKDERELELRIPLVRQIPEGQDIIFPSSN